MSLLDTLRKGVLTIDKATKSLQTSVSYVKNSAHDEYGAPATVAAATTLKAIVDYRHVPVRSKEGITVMASATLTLLNVQEVYDATGGLGVDTDDEFTLPDGSKSKVISVGGFMDAGTYGPIPLTIYLG